MGFRQSPSVTTRNGWLWLEPGAVFSIGAAWGSLEPEALEESTPNLMCHAVAELTGYLTRRFGMRDTLNEMVAPHQAESAPPPIRQHYLGGN